MEKSTDIICWFHRLWDGFPGMACLIDGSFNILAANDAARSAGFCEDLRCIKVGEPSIHKDCRVNAMRITEKGQTVETPTGKIKGWAPVEGCNDLFVHFTLERGNEGIA